MTRPLTHMDLRYELIVPTHDEHDAAYLRNGDRVPRRKGERLAVTIAYPLIAILAASFWAVLGKLGVIL